MGIENTEKVRIWQVLLTIFVPFVGSWFLVKPTKPKWAQYSASIYSLLAGLSAFSANAGYNALEGLFFFLVCALPMLYLLDNKVLEKRARRRAESEALDARVKEILETEPMVSKDDRLEELERKYS